MNAIASVKFCVCLLFVVSCVHSVRSRRQKWREQKQKIKRIIEKKETGPCNHHGFWIVVLLLPFFVWIFSHNCMVFMSLWSFFYAAHWFFISSVVLPFDSSIAHTNCVRNPTILINCALTAYSLPQPWRTKTVRRAYGGVAISAPGHRWFFWSQNVNNS